MNSGAECVVRNWPPLDYTQPKKPVPESAHIPLFVYRDYFTSFYCGFTLATCVQLLVPYDLKPFAVIVGLPCCLFPGVASTPHPWPLHLPVFGCNLFE